MSTSVYTGWEKVLILLPITYVPLSYGVYVFLLYVILFSKVRQVFNTSFYHMYAASVVVDILGCSAYMTEYYYLINPWLSQTIKNWPETLYAYNVLHFVMFHGHYTHTLLMTFISFNRFVVLVIGNKWNVTKGPSTLGLITAAIVLPLVFTWSILTNKFSLQLEARIPAWWVREFDRSGFFRYRSLHSFIIYTVCALVALVLNLMVCIQLLLQRLHKDKLAPFGSKHNNDDRLFVFTVISFVVQVLFASIQCYFMYNRNDHSILGDYLLKVQSYLMQVDYLLPAWSLLVTSKQLRGEVRKLVTSNLIKSVEISNKQTVSP